MYVFTSQAGSWTQTQKLIPSDAAQQALLGARGFGRSLSSDGNVLLVGERSGQSAYLFRFNGAMWVEEAILKKPLTSPGSDNFGHSVAINGETIIVGAYADTIEGRANQGSAYVFVRSGTNWSQQSKLIANDGAAGDSFGNSVGISGDTVVVGAFADNVGVNLAQGSAYVFVRSGTNWTQQAHLLANNGAAIDFFGVAVAIANCPSSSRIMSLPSAPTHVALAKPRLRHAMSPPLRLMTRLSPDGVIVARSDLSAVI